MASDWGGRCGRSVGRPYRNSIFRQIPNLFFLTTVYLSIFSSNPNISQSACETGSEALELGVLSACLRHSSVPGILSIKAIAFLKCLLRRWTNFHDHFVIGRLCWAGSLRHVDVALQANNALSVIHSSLLGKVV